MRVVKMLGMALLLSSFIAAAVPVMAAPNPDHAWRQSEYRGHDCHRHRDRDGWRCHRRHRRHCDRY